MSDGGRRPKRDRKPTPFGRWLLAELKRQPMGRSDLAREMGVEPSAISKWIYYSVPSPASCDLIAAAFRIPLDRVLSAAGHRHQTELRGEVRLEIANMLQMIPEPLLIGVAIQLRALTQSESNDRAIARLTASLARYAPSSPVDSEDDVEGDRDDRPEI